jgi:hypothetical protein
MTSILVGQHHSPVFRELELYSAARTEAKALPN